jgi:hypothetical protein
VRVLAPPAVTGRYGDAARLGKLARYTAGRVHARSRERRRGQRASRYETWQALMMGYGRVARHEELNETVHWCSTRDAPTAAGNSPNGVLHTSPEAFFLKPDGRLPTSSLGPGRFVIFFIVHDFPGFNQAPRRCELARSNNDGRDREKALLLPLGLRGDCDYIYEAKAAWQCVRFFWCQTN